MKRLTLLLFVFAVGCGTSTSTEEAPQTSSEPVTTARQQPALLEPPHEEQREPIPLKPKPEKVPLTKRELKPLSAYSDAISVAELEDKYFTKYGQYDRVQVRGVIRGLYTEKQKGADYRVYFRLYSTKEEEVMMRSITYQLPLSYKVSSLVDIAGLHPEQEIVVEGKPVNIPCKTVR